MATLIDGTYNSRDVAGIPLASGGSISSGVLYRSDALVSVTDAGEATIAASPIGTIVDYRLPDGVKRVAFPMLDGAVRETAASVRTVPTLSDVYGHLLERHGTDFAMVARLIARPADPSRPAVLVHCTAGKDRTGVAVALMLDAAGAARDGIIDDYLDTEQNLSGEWADAMRARIVAAGIPVSPELEELLARTPRPAMESVFARVDADGGTAEYLLRHGLSASDLAALRARLRGA
jgi:protein-tyrosine phosphatase